MSEPRLTEQLEAGRDRFAGSNAGLGIRRAALDRFNELGFPNRSDETWHYTDLSALSDKPFVYIVPEPNATTLDLARERLATLGLDASAPRLVFLDGQLCGDLSTRGDTQGIELTELADARAPADPGAGDSALVALSRAFATTRILLRITGSVAAPLQLVFIGSGRSLAPQTRIRIELAQAAEANIVMQSIDLDNAGEAWLNLVVEIEQAESSRLRLQRLQEHGPEQYGTTLVRARLARRASFDVASIELGGKLVRNEIQVSLDGEEASANLAGLALARDRQHCDFRIDVDHRAPRTTSFQEYRAIVADRARSVFNGKVSVRQHAQHIEARQRNDNLLLSAGAEVDTKPELEIYADQVICSHGATVGELSDDQLFYLQSRGIDAATARGMLTAAFAARILDRISGEAFVARVHAAVDARLPRRVDLG